MSDQRQICYFPYLFMGNVKLIKFSIFTVWNFSALCHRRIKDTKLRNYIRKLLESNTKANKPIDGIGIISFNDKDDFKIINEKKMRMIDELKSVIFLSMTSRKNVHSFRHSGFMMVTSENCNVIYQNFTLDSKHTSYSTGRIVNIITGGHKVGELKYEMPKHVLSPKFEYDDKLLEILQDIKKNNSKLFRTIVRATDAFMNAYKNSDDLSYESRILEQARSFEILFRLPEGGQRKEFKFKIDHYCSLNDERRIRYKSERTNNKKVWEIGTRHKLWADRFYTLRNHIIHGEPLTDKDFSFNNQRHIDIALWFFIVSVKQLINEVIGKNIFLDKIRVEEKQFEYDRQPLKLIAEQIWNEMKLNKSI